MTPPEIVAALAAQAWAAKVPERSLGERGRAALKRQADNGGGARRVRGYGGAAG